MALGEAFINVRADLRPFTRDLAKELKLILNAAEKEVATRGNAIGRKLSDTIAAGARKNAHKIGDVISRETEKRKITIKTEVDKNRAVSSAREALNGIENLAESAGTSIAKRLADTFTSAARFIKGTFGQLLGSLGAGGGRGGIGGAVLAGVIAVIVAMLAALIPLAVQAAQAVGGLVAALALLPAAGAAVGVVMGVLSLAFQGFDKAISAALTGDMDAFKKSLEGLTPAARGVAKAIQPFLTSLAKAVQEGFFSSAAGGIKALFASLKGSGVQGALVRISRLFGSIVSDIARWIGSKDGMDIVRLILRNITDSLVALRPALVPLSKAITTLVRAGSSVLPAVANVIARLAEDFAKFIDEADKSGQLAGFFTALQRVLQNLGPIIEEAFTVLLEFLNWAVRNPDAILNIATAFFTLAEALGQAFSDPQVLASIQIIAGILASIPPETWAALAVSIVRFATAIGILGAALIFLGGIVAFWNVKINDFFSGLNRNVTDVGKKLRDKAKDFRNAGAALMASFFDGLRSAVGTVKGVAEAIVSRIKSAINSAISGVNRGLASAFSVFGINPPDIPFLAKGGVITGPTLAMVGEKGPEAVVPLNDPGAAAAVLMKSGLANLMSPVVQVFLGTEQLEQRMYRVVAQNNSTQAMTLRHGPRTA